MNDGRANRVAAAACLAGRRPRCWRRRWASRRGRPRRASRCPGITPGEFEEFRLGLDDFLEVETAEEGLGPAFNGTSCAACHNVPAVGGISPVAEVRAARRLADGSVEAVAPDGESLFHLFSVPGHACQPPIPPEANVIVRRVPIPVFGAGLVEAIDDGTILALEDVPGPRPRRRERAGRPHHRPRHRRAPRRAVRLEGAARHAAGLRRRCLSQRDGHHQRSLPDRARRRHRRRADAAVRSDSRPRGHRRSAHPAPRHRQLRQLHALPGAGRARPDRRRGRRGRAACSRRSAAPAATCRR